jgi:hypothetical protein
MRKRPTFLLLLCTMSSIYSSSPSKEKEKEDKERFNWMLLNYPAADPSEGGKRTESLEDFTQNELYRLKGVLSSKITGATDVDPSDLLKRIAELQGKPDDYYKKEGAYGFGWWIYDVADSVKGPPVLDEKIKEALDASEELKAEIARLYPSGRGVFYQKRLSLSPRGYHEYPYLDMKDDPAIKKLKCSCLKIIARAFYERYGNEDIFSEEYKRHESHKELRERLIALLNGCISEFVKQSSSPTSLVQWMFGSFVDQSSSFTSLIQRMLEMNLRYYKKEARPSFIR